jgi:hypothetical protein
LTLPNCDCEECRAGRARWIEDVASYAAFLEAMVQEIAGVAAERGGGRRARKMVKVLAGICERRGLGKEIAAADRERDAATAAEAREAGRLH